jgi:hypothetical protein
MHPPKKPSQNMSPTSLLDRFFTLIMNPNADRQPGQPLWRYVRFSVFPAHNWPPTNPLNF